MEQRCLLTTFQVINTLDDGQSGSLRWAIGQANAGAGGDRIEFDIPGGGVRTIGITSALPAITKPVTIDATTQPGYDAAPVVQLDGSAAGTGVDGLTILGGGTSVIGLGIGNFAGNAINIVGPGGNIIRRNVIGLDADGTSTAPNGLHGVLVVGDNNAIGGPNPGDGNLISANGGYGINLSSANSNQIQANQIGVDATGTLRRGNEAGGILIVNGQNNVIGGTSPAVRNLISGNRGSGIETFGTTDGLLVAGNIIGTDASLQANLGNSGDGVHLFSSNCTIGGSAPGAGNFIAYNGNPTGPTGSGIALITNVSGNLILGNSIFSNVGLGINLGGLGNQNQQAPSLGAASTNGTSTNVAGLLSSSDPNSLYVLEFFANPTADSTNLGEGQVFLGRALVTTDDSGNASFNLVLNTPAFPGAFISSTATDPQGNTSGFSANVSTRGEADVAVSLGADPSSANVGDTITYVLQVRNNGPTPARGVTSVFQIPANATLVGFESADAIIVSGSTSITFIFGFFDVGDVGTATIVVQTTAASSPSLVASATVSSIEGDPFAPNNLITVETPVSPVAGLTLTMEGAPSTIAVGENVTYTVTVTNTGPSAANNVTLVDTLPQHVTLVSAHSVDGPTLVQGNVVTTTIATLLSGDSAVLIIVVTAGADALPSIKNRATVSADESDPDLSDNSAEATTVVTPVADLQVTISDSPDPVQSGQNITYTVTVTNNGPSTASNVSLVDQLPAGTTFVSAADNVGGNLVRSGAVVTDTIASLAPGASFTLTIVVQAPGVTTGLVTNDASVTADEPDPDLTNNLDSETTVVSPVSDLRVGIAGTPGTVGAGQTVTYTITVTNNGPSPASGVSLLDTLPANVTVSSVTMSQGTSTQGNGTVTGVVGSLSVGGTATMTIVITTSGANPPGISDTVTATANEFDPNLVDNTATTATTVTPVSDLAVNIALPPGTVHVNDNVTYTVTVTNNGPSPATGVTLVDTLPANATFISASDSLGNTLTPSGGILTDNIGALGAGATVTLTIVVRTTGVGQLLESATVSGAQDDSAPVNNTSVLVTPVLALADLSLSLTADQSQLTRGQTLTYIATVTNNGPADATGVVLGETLPAGMTIVSIAAGQGGLILGSGQVTANIGNLAVGATATLTIVVIATVSGPATNLASVVLNEDDTTQANNTATVQVLVLQTSGTIEFATTILTVNENARTASVLVSRNDGAHGQVSVNFATTPAGSAVAGRDFRPVAGTLVFAQGETSKVISVPILANAHNRGAKTVRLALSAVGGGAVLGSQVATTVVIRDLNPDFAAPKVKETRLYGPATSIQMITLFFSEDLDPVKARRMASYQLFDVGADGRFGTRDDRRLGIRAPIYNATNDTVSIQPLQALAANRFFYVRTIGLTDLAGNGVSPGPGGVPGGFATYVARGTSLLYPDSRGTQVALKITGGGLIDLTRFANGNGNRLQVLQPVPRRTVLTGRVRGGSGATTLQSITGLGVFGQVRVDMTTAPIYVAQMPFNRSVISPPAVDGVFGTGGLKLARSVRSRSR